MQQWKVRPPRRGIDLLDDAPACGGRSGRRSGRFIVRVSHGVMNPGLRHEPGLFLAQVGEQLQQVVSDLEDVMFEAPGIGRNCRSDIHDAIGLVMEALQVLGQARASLERSGALGAGAGTAALLAVPLAQA